MAYDWKSDVVGFYRRMAVQHIGYWRQQRSTAPKTSAWNRKMALAYLSNIRRLERG